MREPFRNQHSSEIDPEYLSCPKCGFPNKPTSKTCMYCRASLVHSSVTLSIFQYVRAYAEMLRWRTRWGRKKSFPGGRGFTFVGKALTWAICLGLIVFGGSMFFSSVSEGSFFNFLLAGVCLSYGGMALYKLIRE